MSEITWNTVEELGAELGMSAEALRKWRLRGVPKSREAELLERARAAQIELSLAQLRALSTARRK